jgi:pyruvate,water dikinase
MRPESPFGPAWKSNLRIALRHPLSLAFWCNIDYYYRRWNREWQPTIEQARPDLATASVQDIRTYIELLELQRRDRRVVAGLAVGYAPNFLGLVAWLLQRWLPDAPPDTPGVLTSGLPGSFTHRENVELWELTRSAADHPRVALKLLDGRFDELDGEFIARVDAFRRKHAHRGCSDRDIYQRRWGDSRELLLQQVVMMLKLGRASDPQAAHARAAARRTDREHQLMAELKKSPLGWLRAPIFFRVLRAAQRYVMHRDNQRHTFEPYFYNLRLAYRAIGDRLRERGVLADRDDVFFLGKHEIYAHMDGRLPDAKVSGRVRWRRSWWEEVTLQEPPARLRGYRPYEPVGETGAADLQGAPGAPGVATGPVRKIASLQELSTVQPGEIVVTYAIDPAWTPVFGIIAGAISVEGGMLAHAAVLGREYGLPVVLGVRDAIARLKDGDRVRIDGTLGSVTFANEEL